MLRIGPLFIMLTAIFSCNVETFPKFNAQDYSSQNSLIYAAFKDKPVELTLSDGNTRCINFGSYCPKLDSQYSTQPSNCRAIGENAELKGRLYCGQYIKNSDGTKLFTDETCRPCADLYKNFYRVRFRSVRKDNHDPDPIRDEFKDAADFELENLRAACGDESNSFTSIIGVLLTESQLDLDATEFSSSDQATETNQITTMKIHEANYCSENYPIAP